MTTGGGHVSCLLTIITIPFHALLSYAVQPIRVSSLLYRTENVDGVPQCQQRITH